MNARLAGGGPVVIISGQLRNEPLVATLEACGLPVHDFTADDRGELAFEGGWPYPCVDTLLAIVAHELESAKLLQVFAALQRSPPPILVRPSCADALAKIVELFLSRSAAVRASEASLREQLVVMRREAEETRSALHRLTSAFAPFATQRLVGVWLDDPSDSSKELSCRGAFDLHIPTTAEIHGLTAVSLHLAAELVFVGDRLEILLLSEENDEVLGTWAVPEAELPRTRTWMTLGLPVSLSQARRTARVRVRGQISERSVIAFSLGANSAAEGQAQVALRLYASPTPRFATAPFWIQPDLATSPAPAALAIPAHCWLGASVRGASSEDSQAHAEKRLFVRSGDTALLRFPHVPTAQASAVAVRLRSRGGEDISASVALLATEDDPSLDPAMIFAAALRPSPLQNIGSDSSLVLAALPEGAPPTVHIAVTLHNEDESGDGPALVICEGVWLVGRSLAQNRETPATRAPSLPSPDTDFDDVRLDETYADGNYRHLDLTVSRLSASGALWREVKFKLFEERGTPGLEFRSGADLPACFLQWPGTQADRFGPHFKLTGPQALVAASQTLPEEADRRLLVALQDVLPNLVRAVAARGEIRAEDRESWLAIARSLRRAPGDVDAG